MTRACYTGPELAQALGVADKTIRAMADRGDISPVLRVGRRIRIPRGARIRSGRGRDFIPLAEVLQQ